MTESSTPKKSTTPKRTAKTLKPLGNLQPTDQSGNPITSATPEKGVYYGVLV